MQSKLDKGSDGQGKPKMAPITHIPMLPVLSWAELPGMLWRRDRLQYDSKSLRFVNSGRAALALALTDSNVSSGDDVLLPAYHCPSMVYPVHWLKARPVFYRIEADTRPSITDRPKHPSTTHLW